MTKPRNRGPRPCRQCGAIIDGHALKEFCDDRCLRANRRDGRRKTGVCRVCSAEFLRDRNHKGIMCSAECRRTYHQREKRRWWLWSRYRLTPEQHDAMLAAGCAICGTTERLHVDHDHACCPLTPGTKRTCGQCVRGVLCSSHNSALGMLRDDPALCRALADYIEAARAA